MITVTEIIPGKNGKMQVAMDNGQTFTAYRSEIASSSLQTGVPLTEEQFDSICTGIIGKRAKKRAMHLLEQMDRTEYQLRTKLEQNGFPEKSIDAAIEYVTRFHYLDDRRYAENFVRCAQEKMSRQQITAKLRQKGLSGPLISEALEQEYESDELEKINVLLQKKHYDPEAADPKEEQRIYGFLMRRGFKSSDVLKAMRGFSELA